MKNPPPERVESWAVPITDVLKDAGLRLDARHYLRGRNWIGDREYVMAHPRHRDVTLDGEPAVILGGRLDYAYVCVVNSPLTVEFSWAATRRILDQGGAFRT